MFIVDDNKFNNDDSNNDTGGSKSKWNDRLFKMRKKKLKSKNKELADNDNFIKRIFKNVMKIGLVFPSFIYSNIKYSDDKKNKNNNNKNENKDIEGDKNKDKNNDTSMCNDDIVQRKDSVMDRDDIRKYRNSRVDEIRSIDSFSLRKNNQVLNIVKFDKEKLNDNTIELRKKKLQKEIINLIKKKLVKTINELEMLDSEFYVLEQLGEGYVYLDECRNDIKEIKKLLSKIKVLKERYDYLKDNVDFEYMLEYDDLVLVDKILELKDICSDSDIKLIVDDYKIMDEYKYLYLEIDKVQDKIIKYDEYKKQRECELKQRDIDFEKMKLQLYNIDREKERYDSFVLQQEKFLQQFSDEVGKINSYEKVTYKLKGFNQLLANSFKYLGLLLVNPLKGVLPGIVTQTAITKNLVHNLYNNLCYEETKTMINEAIDYSSMIDGMLNNLDSTAILVDSTLDEIIKLKNKYISEFSQYESSFSSYKETIRKLNKMENAIVGNKIKIDNLRLKMKEKEIENGN